MERITRFRSRVVILIFIAVILFFSGYLYHLQIIETGGSKDNTTTFTTLTRVKGVRGNLMDTNGNLLAGNRASYDLTINHYVIKSAPNMNENLYRLIKRCQEQNIEYTEHFPISRERPFVYTLDTYSTAWQSYFQTFLADKGGLDSDITAPLLMETLRQRYNIPAEWSEEDARLVIGLRYELDLRGPVQSLPVYVFLSDVSDEQLSAIVELNIPGVKVEASTVREYNTDYAAHIIGYVGPMSAAQWEKYKNNPDYALDSDVGQDGLEAAFEEFLHGVDGWRVDEFKSDGTIVNSYYMDGEEPRAGANVEVTIDLHLQQTAEDKLASVIENLRNKGSKVEGAAVVAMEVKTGKVLVCGSYPTYKLSTYAEDYNEILQTPYAPLFNRALQGLYPPGSTYKMSMVIAGIDSGVITSETKVYDKGIFNKYSGFSVGCYYYTGEGRVHGWLDAADALKFSCNYFFYDLGDKIRLSAMDSTAKALGLGEKTGIELPEYVGHRANEETKKKLYSGDKSGWYKADQITASIGQSDNSFTPMQLCNYAATLANRGTRYKATFLNRVVSADYREILAKSDVTVVDHLEISDDAYYAYSEGMQRVAHATGGTAEGAFWNYPIRVAAKTGTAQTADPNGVDNGAFVCYAPADNPKIAIAIYAEKSDGGSSLAVIAKEILNAYFEVGEIGDVNIYENTIS